MTIERNCIELGPCDSGIQIAQERGLDTFDTQTACISGIADCKLFEKGFSDYIPAEAVAVFTCGVEATVAFGADIDAEQGAYDA